MKKYLLLGFFIILFSCEKDDFCTQKSVTPKFVIRFMDNVDVTRAKKIDSLSVWAVGKKDSIYKKVNLDSIAIPLNSQSKKTVYNFSKGKDSITEITILYEPKEEFVSRSCGYRIIFDKVQLSKKKSNTSWIDRLSTNTVKTINNQTNAHVIFYH